MKPVSSSIFGFVALGSIAGIAALTAVSLNAEPAQGSISGPVAVAAAAAAGPAATAAQPTVVELYESQGCSSCPPANTNVNALAGRPDILALNFAVTYWDQLGWKDTFAKPAYTARQWDYARAAGRPQVATPQVIINGGATVVGSNPTVLANAIRANSRRGGPAISASAGKVVIGKAAASAPATVWLVHYDPRNLVVPVRAGENGGRSLAHRNIVRSLDAIGTWNGEAMTLSIPATDGNTRSAILVQQGKGGKIVAASRI